MADTLPGANPLPADIRAGRWSRSFRRVNHTSRTRRHFRALI